MPLEQITLVFFAISNRVRLLAYVPQIYKASVDQTVKSRDGSSEKTAILCANRYGRVSTGR